MKILINEQQLNLLLEQNSDLENRVFAIPINIINHLKQLLDNDNTKGKKRLKFLISEKKISYYEIKRIKNYLDKHDPKTEEYIQAGGEMMHKWVNSVLNSNRKSIKSTKRHKSAILDNQFIKSHTKNVIPRIKAKDFKLSLNEEIYPIKNLTKNEEKYHIRYKYEFNNGKRDYIVEFTKRTDDNDDEWERFFYPKASSIEYHLTKDNQPFSMYSTIANITKDFIEKIKPDVIIITHAYENSKDVFVKNRRGMLNYRALKNVIPSDYDIKIPHNTLRELQIIKKG